MSRLAAKRLRALRIGLLATTALVAVGDRACAATFNVANEAQLITAINAANANGDAASTINITANIPLSGLLPTLGLTGAAKTLTVNGGGFTIDGQSARRIFFVNSGAVTIQNTTLANGRAAGGSGGNTDIQGGAGGGGGMGAGGAVFVRSGASLVLERVAMTGSSAVGGAGGAQSQSIGSGSTAGGGGGGMGGNGGLGVYDSDEDAAAGGGGGGLAPGSSGGDGTFSQGAQAVDRTAGREDRLLAAPVASSRVAAAGLGTPSVVLEGPEDSAAAAAAAAEGALHKAAPVDSAVAAAASWALAASAAAAVEAVWLASAGGHQAPSTAAAARASAAQCSSWTDRR